MKGIRQELEEKYENLFRKYGFEHPVDAKKINYVIKEALREFFIIARKPAVYCNGGHTRMLMADFMYELKNVRYIVDNYASEEKDGGFSVIRDADLEEKEIDAVILSTFKFRQDVKQSLAVNHPGIPTLDIYDEFEKNGIIMQADYYYSHHPYHHYHSINYLQREIRETADTEKLEGLYKELISKYIHIRDFRTALLKTREFGQIKPAEWIKTLECDLTELYESEQEAAAAVSDNNILMFCLDGLRRQDLSERDMPKVKRILDETAYSFTNAYSFSTSTFESLIPVYSENCDLRTHYYEKNEVAAEDCRFFRLAERQKRSIYIYADMEHYIESSSIHYSDQFQTVTEKIWDFILDGCEEKNGLFYLHESYESHFTFSNPYTPAPLKSEGTAMLFDFLPVKGGRLRADYKAQHQDAVRYLDDVLEPFLLKLSCRMVLYADHGNLILEKDTKLSEVKDMEYVCSEGWTRIPLMIRCPEMGIGKNDDLISLTELNSMLVSLLNKEDYIKTGFRKRHFIKMARSELYNPDFRFLYRITGKEQYLQAFECFLFEGGEKLIIFADGYMELRSAQDDRLIPDEKKRERLLNEIQDEITVTDCLSV